MGRIKPALLFHTVSAVNAQTYLNCKQIGDLEMITIKEIANMLNVSTTTVSNVIHGKTKEVSPANVERIRKVLEEYDYMPNINARNLASKRSRIIGMVVKVNGKENPFKDQFFGELLGAVEERVRSKGYNLMVYALNDVQQVQKFILSWNMDGLVTCGFVEGEISYLQERYKKPIVIIDDYDTDDLDNCINVRLEDKKAAYEMTKYVIGCGHKKIAFLADNNINLDHQRFLGYCQAMEEAGLPDSEENFLKICSGNRGEQDNLKELCERSYAYTAIICASDYYASMLLNALQDSGRKIPEDISITGFDDVEYASLVRPALTTVRQDIQEKGQVAVDMLVKMLEGKPEEAETLVVLPTRMVIRDSVRNINK